MEKLNYKSVEYYAEVIANIFFSLLFLFFLNNYYSHIPFLTPDFSQVIDLFNMAVAVGIGFQLSRLAVKDNYYKRISELVNNAILIYIYYQLWTIFPFNTSVIGEPSTWDNIFRLIIVISIFASVATIVSNLVRSLSLSSK